MPNGEAADVEMPGKSSSEDEPQGAAFSGGESLMGTLSDSFDKLKNCLQDHVYFFPVITPLHFIFFDTSGENSQLDLDSMVGPGLSSLSNDEAAMAVIMSLLETDANLDEAVDFEEMHWSL